MMDFQRGAGAQRAVARVAGSEWMKLFLVSDYAGVNHTLLTYDTNTTNITITGHGARLFITPSVIGLKWIENLLLCKRLLYLLLVIP